MNFIKLLSGDTEIVRHIHTPGDFVFVSEDIRSEGFHIQPENVRFKHVFDLGGTGARIWVDAPRGGAYYLALQVQDTYGNFDEEFRPMKDREEPGPFAERLVELSVGGRPVGCFRFGGDDRKHYLFVTEQPVDLKRSEEICYRVLAGARAYFTAVILTKTRPLFPTNAILNLSEENGSLRFTTKLASRIDLSFGEKVFSQAQYLNNHRFEIPPALFGVRFQITATDEDGGITRGRYVCSAGRKAEREDRQVRIPLENTLTPGRTTPVQSVAPLEQGRVFSGEDFVICDGDGAAYATDAKVTARWQDGSVRTVALLAILPGDGRAFYAVNKTASPGTEGFFARETPEGAQVVCAGRTYCFSNQSASILPDKELYAVLYDEETNPFVAGGGVFRVTEQGKNKLTVSRENYFQRDGQRHFSSAAHVSFYRGFDAYQLDYAFGNEFIEAEHTNISGIYLEGRNAGGEAASVYQYYDNKAVIDGVERTARHNGAFALKDGSMVIEDFWQNYPKSVRIGAEDLSIGLCPLIEKPERYRSDDIVYESKLFFYLKDGCYRLHAGIRKYHTIYFGNDIECIRTIPFFIPDRRVTEAALAFGRILTASGKTARYDGYMADSLEKYMAHRENNQEYGMLNYGDSHGERQIHWTNMEYDFPYGTLIHFLRTGDERFYRLGKTAAAHLEEIDCAHRHWFFEEKGYFWIHTVGHGNNYYTPEELPNCFILINSHIGHIFLQGLCEYYKMTGQERFKDALLSCADSVAKYYTVKYDFLTEREPGWSMLLLEAAYELTLDPYYLNACRLILERVYQKQDRETGCLKYFMRLSESEELKTGDVCYGGKSFMHGILGSAMKYFYYLTGDERACEGALRIARWLAEDMFDEEMRCFWYTDVFKQLNKRTRIPEANIEIIDVIMFAYLKTRNPYYLDVVKKAFLAMLESPYRTEHDIAKVFTMRMRFSPEILHDLDEAGSGI